MRLSFRVNLVANAPECENRGESPSLQLVFGDDQRLFDIHTLDQYLTLDTRGEGRALCAGADRGHQLIPATLVDLVEGLANSRLDD